eukprot:320143-Chlamydomonas_euryale.AAC.2
MHVCTPPTRPLRHTPFTHAYTHHVPRLPERDKLVAPVERDAADGAAKLRVVRRPHSARARRRRAVAAVAAAAGVALHLGFRHVAERRNVLQLRRQRLLQQRLQQSLLRADGSAKEPSTAATYAHRQQAHGGVSSRATVYLQKKTKEETH